MKYEDLIKSIKHIDEKNILSIIKNKDPEISIKEAVSNALEAIKLKNTGTYKTGEISIQIFIKQDLVKEETVDHIVIKDNGIGLDETNFKRFAQFINRTKGYQNKGTGRFSIISRFNAHYSSIFVPEGTNIQQAVEFDFKRDNSPDSMFCSNFNEPVINNGATTGTTVELYPTFDFKYDISHLKSFIYHTFLLEFLLKRDQLPKITLEQYVKYTDKPDYIQTAREIIDSADLPTINCEENLTLYTKTIENNEIIDNLSEPINFSLISLKSEDFKKNEIVLTSNNISVEKLSFSDLSKDETIDNMRYLLLVKSPYLDEEENTNNERTCFNFKTKREAKQLAKEPHFQEAPFLVREDLSDNINKKFAQMVPEIRERKEQKNTMLEDIKRKYLISDEIFKKAKEKLTLDSSESDILKAYYTTEGEVLAENTLKIEEKIEKVKALSPSDPDSKKSLEDLTKEITALIPQQGRAALAQYVTRRRLILDWFGDLLDKAQRDPSVLEKEFHNLFIKQHTDNSVDSNLWIFNEDFIYFPGHSDETLADAQIKGKKVFKEQFKKEEKRYLTSLGENRTLKRPDVLLFPEENKCIIIEFKKPSENVSYHLNQISTYASLILNYSKEEFDFKQFYGYLVGEAIEPRDVIHADSDFIPSYYNDYLFRPDKRVVSETSKPDGTLYTEILKYSILLKRARLRNKIFIDKLNETN